MKKLILEQGSDEWLEFRKTGVGASDLAAIIGISPFKKAIDVYNEKLNLAPPQFMSNAMLRGNVYEGEARDKHNQVHNCNFQPLVVQHEEFDFFYASLDGYDESSNQILEIKVPTSQTLMSKVSCGNIPDYYESQIQWQMFISGAVSAVFAVYCPESGVMEEILVDRDEGRIEYLKESAMDFWDLITNRIEPEDLTKHVELEFPDNIEKFVEYCTYQRVYKEASEKMKELKAFLVDLGDDGNWFAHGVKFTISKGKDSYNHKAMEADGIDLKKYKKTGIPFYKISIIKDEI